MTMREERRVTMMTKSRKSGRRAPRLRVLGAALTVAALIGGILSGGIATAADELGLCEPTMGQDSAGNSPAQANFVRPPVACVGELNSDVDEDWFYFTLEAGGSFSIVVRQLSQNTSSVFEIKLLDPSGTDISQTPHVSVPTTPPTTVTAHCAKNSEVSHCEKTNAQAGTATVPWKFGIKRASGVRGMYFLSVQTSPTLPPPPGSCEVGASNNDPEATSDEFNATPVACTGQITPGSDQDWFAIPVPANDSLITVMLKADTGSFELLLKDPTDRVVNTDVLAGQNGVNVFACRQGEASVCVKPGAAANGAGVGNKWRVGVRSNTGTTGTYALAIQVTAVAVPNVLPGCELDANGAPQDAGDDTQMSLPPNQGYRAPKPAPTNLNLPPDSGMTLGNCKGELATGDDGDNYTITLTRSDNINMGVSLQHLNPQSSFILCVRSPADATDVCDNSQAGAPRLVRRIAPHQPSAAQRGTWLIKVKWDSIVGAPRGEYLLQVGTYDN